MAAYERWSLHLLDLATERLDRHARLYVGMRRQGAPVKDIARAAGLTPKTLWNKFGGQKIVLLVRDAVRSYLARPGFPLPVRPTA